MTHSILLPDESGSLSAYRLQGDPVPVPAGPHRFNRVAFSAAHVVADPVSAREPSLGPSLDWDATLRFRRHLLDGARHSRSHGYGAARHGPRLERRARTDPPFSRRSGTGRARPPRTGPPCIHPDDYVAIYRKVLAQADQR